MPTVEASYSKASAETLLIFPSNGIGVVLQDVLVLNQKREG